MRLVLVLLLSQSWNRPVGLEGNAADAEIIRRVVLGHMLASGGARDPKHKVYFLSVEDNKDPSDELYKAFKQANWPVKRESESEERNGPDFSSYAVADRVTGEIGAVLSIDEIRWSSAKSAVVKAALFSGGLYGRGYIYSVVKRGRWWFVNGRKLDYLS